MSSEARPQARISDLCGARWKPAFTVSLFMFLLQNLSKGADWEPKEPESLIFSINIRDDYIQMRWSDKRKNRKISLYSCENGVIFMLGELLSDNYLMFL